MSVTAAFTAVAWKGLTDSTERPESSIIRSWADMGGFRILKVVLDHEVPQSQCPLPSFEKDFSDALTVQLNSLLSPDGRTEQEWYRGCSKAEAKAVRSFMSDVPDAMVRSMPEAYNIPVHGPLDQQPVIGRSRYSLRQQCLSHWLRRGWERILRTVLTPDMSFHVLKGSPYFARSVSELGLAMAAGDCHQTLRIYEDLEKFCPHALSYLLSHDSESNNGDFQAVLYKHLYQATTLTSVHQPTSTQQPNPFASLGLVV